MGGDSTRFFADAEISSEEQYLLLAGEKNTIQEYGASAKDGKWSASLSVGDGSYSLMIIGGVINNAINISFPDT